MRSTINQPSPHQELVYVHASVHCDAAPKVVFKGLLPATSRRMIAEQFGEILRRTSQSGPLCGGLEGAKVTEAPSVRALMPMMGHAACFQGHLPVRCSALYFTSPGMAACADF